ncbi:MAG: Tim44/TimA family putative adaptor protein [Pseudomonadota bacterium]
MNDNDLLVLVILAIVAGFLLFRLRSVLGDRSGFDKPEKYARTDRTEQPQNGAEPDSDAGNVVTMPRRGDDQADADIFAYTEIDSPLGQQLKAIKTAEPGFDLRDFVEGSKGAYEMLLIAYETGDKSTLKTFLADEVYQAFAAAIDQRTAQKLNVDMRFVGIRSAEPVDASFNETSREAEIAVKFVAEIVMVVRNAQGEVVEGDPGAVRRIGDTWTFGRIMGGNNPNWTLIATGE